MNQAEEFYLEHLKEKATTVWARAFLTAKELERHEDDLFFADRPKLIEEFKAAWSEYKRLEDELETLNARQFFEFTTEWHRALAERDILFTVLKS